MTVKEIQQADPLARRRALIYYLFFAFFGLLLVGAISLYEDSIHSWVEKNAGILIAERKLVFLGALLLATPLYVTSGYLWRYANRCIDTKRMPPPGYAVIRPTPVRTGTSVVRAARVLQALSLLVVISSTALSVVLWIILSELAV